ncbi:MAG: DUF4339 domain-containing protein [Oligoflexia bacterium]|nr:DUF4339 domain-containing protein [Oligoflexia bacterium]
MRVGISTKLIAMVTVLVIAAISVVVKIATDLYQEESLTRVQETNKDVAESLAAQVYASFRDATDKATLIARTLTELRSKKLTPESSRLIESVLRSNDELLSVGLYRPEPRGGYNEVFWLSKSEVLAEFGILESDLKMKPANQLTSAVRDRPDELSVINIAPHFKKPILMMGFLTKENEKNKERWLVRFEMRQEPLIKVFMKKPYLTSYLVDSQGRLLVHSKPEIGLQNYNMSVFPIVEKFKTGKLNNHQMEFVDSSDVTFLGAFKATGVAETAVVTQVEKDQALAAVKRVQYRAILVTLIVVGIAFILNFVFSQSMTSPLSYLYWATKKIADGDFNVKLEAQANDEIGALTVAFKQMTHGLKERDQLKATFSKFHSKEIAHKILSGEVKLGGERKMATVFFSDIRGFTSMSERMSPDEVVRMLNEYMTEMVRIIYKHHGVVDKYVGDAIMALWGIPNSGPNDVLHAVQACLEMRRSLITLNQKRRMRGQPALRIGMGLHSGDVLAGNIGSEERLEYTVIGDTVNQASRIESANKELGSDLLISETTYALVRHQGVVVGPPIPIQVKGKSQGIVVYQVIGMQTAHGVETDLSVNDQNRIMQGVHQEVVLDPGPTDSTGWFKQNYERSMVTSNMAPPMQSHDEGFEQEPDALASPNEEPVDHESAPPQPAFSQTSSYSAPKVAPLTQSGVHPQTQSSMRTPTKPAQPAGPQMPPRHMARPKKTAPPKVKPLENTTSYLLPKEEPIAVSKEEYPPQTESHAEPVQDFSSSSESSSPKPSMSPSSGVFTLDSFGTKAEPKTQAKTVVLNTQVQPLFKPQAKKEPVKEQTMAKTVVLPKEEPKAEIQKTQSIKIAPAPKPQAKVEPQVKAEESTQPRPGHLPEQEKFYLVKDPLSKEHDGPYTVTQIRAITSQAGFPFDQAYVFRHGDNQMTPLASMPIFSRRKSAGQSPDAQLPSDGIQNEALVDEWYVYGDETKTYGPYTAEQLKEALEAGHLTRTTYVWRKGLEQWIYCWQVPGLDRRAEGVASKGPIPLTQIKKSS